MEGLYFWHFLQIIQKVFLSQCYSRKGIWWPLESSQHHLVSVSLMLLDCWSSSKSVLCNIETYCPCWTSVVWRLLLCERSPWWACLSSGWAAALMCWTHYFWPPVCPGATSEWKIKRNEGGGAGWKWKREQDGSLWDTSRFLPWSHTVCINTTVHVCVRSQPCVVGNNAGSGRLNECLCCGAVCRRDRWMATPFRPRRSHINDI